MEALSSRRRSLRFDIIKSLKIDLLTMMHRKHGDKIHDSFPISGHTMSFRIYRTGASAYRPCPMQELGFTKVIGRLPFDLVNWYLGIECHQRSRRAEPTPFSEMSTTRYICDGPETSFQTAVMSRSRISWKTVGLSYRILGDVLELRSFSTLSPCRG